jgi:hypothetical protein
MNFALSPLLLEILNSCPWFWIKNQISASILHLTPLTISRLQFQPSLFTQKPSKHSIITNMPLKLFQNYNSPPRNSFSHIFLTTTPIPVILSPKFTESPPLSFHAFIILDYCILIDCVPRVRWSRSRAKAVHEISRSIIRGLRLLFCEQRGNCPWTYCVYFLYLFCITRIAW